LEIVVELDGVVVGGEFMVFLGHFKKRNSSFCVVFVVFCCFLCFCVNVLADNEKMRQKLDENGVVPEGGM